MRGDREPATVAARPDVGVAAGPLLAVRRLVMRARVNDREITEIADLHVGDRKAADGYGPRGLREESRLVRERGVGVRAIKIVGQVLAKPRDVALLHRADISLVEA